MAPPSVPERLRLALMIGPALAVVGLFLAALGIVLARSLNYFPLLGQTEPNLQAYLSVLGQTGFYRSLAFSLHIAVASTALAAGLAVPAALLLRRAFRGRSFVMFVFQIGLTVPHLIGAIGIAYLLSQSGMMARLAHGVGLISGPSDFPALVHDRFGIGIIVQYVWKEVPFIGLIVLAQMQTIGADYEAMARTLGANRWQTFRHVLLPLILPGMLAACVIVFAFTFGAYEIPLLLGPNAPATLPVLAYRRFTDVDLLARPEAMALAVIIAVVSGILVWTYLRLARVRRTNG
jgi:putative spermidine/putrescine transport system permease protein